MKIAKILIACIALSPLASFAASTVSPDNSIGRACGAYISEIRAYAGDYRYTMVDKEGNRISESNVGGYEATDANIIKILNMSYVLNKSVCIDWVYYSTYWHIDGVEILK